MLYSLDSCCVFTCQRQAGNEWKEKPVQNEGEKPDHLTRIFHFWIQMCPCQDPKELKDGWAFCKPTERAAASRWGPEDFFFPSCAGAFYNSGSHGATAQQSLVSDISLVSWSSGWGEGFRGCLGPTLTKTILTPALFKTTQKWPQTPLDTASPYWTGCADSFF